MVVTGGVKLDGEGVDQEKFARRRGLFRFESRGVGSGASRDCSRLNKTQRPSIADKREDYDEFQVRI